MKKITASILLLTLALLLTSCFSFNEPEPEQKEPTEINIHLNGGESDEIQDVDENVTFEDLINSIPTRDGYVFAGWYDDKALTNYINPNAISDEQYSKGTAYAKWIELVPSTYDVRTDTVTITDSGRENQRMDVVYLPNDSYEMKDLIRAGVTTVEISVYFELTEVDDGYQYVFLYNDSACMTNDDSLLDFYDQYVFGEEEEQDPALLYTHKHDYGGGKDTSWGSAKFTAVIDVEDLIDERLYIRYGASGKNEDDWKNRNISITITPMK